MDSLINSFITFTYGMERDEIIITLLTMTLVLGVSILLLFILQVVLHELGHLLFGLLTGYRMLSFRIFSYAIIKQSGKWTTRKYKCPGSAGQCILLPPDKIKQPFVLNVLGGVIFNAFTAAVAVFFALSSIPISFLARIIILIFAFYGFGFSLINGIPLNNLNVINDGAVLRDLRKDSLVVKCYYAQIKLAGYLMKGITYKDIPSEMLFLPAKANLTNSLIGYQKIIESYYYMDCGEWDKARNALYAFSSSMKYCSMIKETVLLETMFLNVMTEQKPIKKVELSNKLKNLLKARTHDFNVYRLWLAYEVSQNFEKINKERIHKELDRMQKDYLYKGEALFCTSLINELLCKYGYEKALE